MTPGILFLTSVCVCAGFYLFARQRALYRTQGQATAFLARHHYHGWWVSLLAFAPVLALLVLWVLAGTYTLETLVLSAIPSGERPVSAVAQKAFFAQIRTLLDGRALLEPTQEQIDAAAIYKTYRALLHTFLAATGIAACLASGFLGLKQSKIDFPAQKRVEAIIKTALLLSSVIAVLTTFAIVLSLLFESLRFFGRVPMTDLFGLQWNPRSPVGIDDTASIGSYGVMPLLVGTLLISLIAMCVAVPVGLMSAIYLSQYAGKRFRAISKPLLEILAGIPTVVYGFFAALLVAPAIRTSGETLGLSVASESALAAGLVMGAMIIPFMSSLSDDAINAVPKAMSNGSLALGATQSETIVRVILPAALPGVVGAILLSVSRAIGETMIVVMAAGLAANLTINPLESVTTVTVQIVKLLTGDQAFETAKTLSAFALGLILFTLTLGMNAVALYLVRQYRETYE